MAVKQDTLHPSAEVGRNKIWNGYPAAYARLEAEKQTTSYLPVAEELAAEEANKCHFEISLLISPHVALPDSI